MRLVVMLSEPELRLTAPSDIVESIHNHSAYAVIERDRSRG